MLESELRTGDIPDSAEAVEALRQECLGNLYFFAKGILGYKDLTHRTHKGFSDWISDDSIQNKLGLMPRGHFKTTLEIAHVVQKLARDRNKRILICSESGENAEYMLQEAQGHIVNNEKVRLLFPEIVPVDINKANWSRKSVTVPRDRPYREPSIDTAGITSKIVSRHYTDIFCDDLVSDEAMYSPTVMSKACHFVDRLVSLLVNPLGDHTTIIGTRWAYHDVYSHVLERYPDFNVFIRKAIVIGKDGPEPFFPERYSMEKFLQIIRTNPEQWATQYANDPMDTATADFKPEWLQYCRIGTGRMLLWEDAGTTHGLSLGALRFYIHVDPSMGEKPTSDYSGIVVVGISSTGFKFVLDAVALRLDPLELTNKIIELSQFYVPSKVTVEDNAFQKSLVYYVKEESRRRGVYVPIEGVTASSHRTKPARIRGALQPQFSTMQIWIRDGLVSLIEEYLKFGKTEHQHLLDALAQGPAVWKAPMHDKERLRYKRVAEERELTTLGTTGYGV